VLPNKHINKTKGNEDENIVLAEIGGDLKCKLRKKRKY
jgi:hypothetical protein